MPKFQNVKYDIFASLCFDKFLSLNSVDKKPSNNDSESQVVITNKQIVKIVILSEKNTNFSQILKQSP